MPKPGGDPCMGLLLSRTLPERGSSFFIVSFFVRSGSPFLRPDPLFPLAVARRSCQGWPPLRRIGTFGLAVGPACAFSLGIAGQVLTFHTGA